MSNVKERFLKYVSYDTRSDDDFPEIPSSEGQKVIACVIADDMRDIGLSDVSISSHGYVYGFIPANIENAPALGFIAHMDTAPDFSGKDVLARTVENYDGTVIILNDDMRLSPASFPELKNYIGNDLIVTDGKTLLGADDKAGVAEILCMAEYILSHPEIKHGRICIGITPDEETGRGADGFDVAHFGADFAYTVDGGALGELEYENFNAADARITVRGFSIHPGSAKNSMVNALHVAEEFDAMLPASERPEHTENYEGFYHLHDFNGSVDSAKLRYIIRDHDRALFEERKKTMQLAADMINHRYGNGTLTLELKDSYYNMKEMILPHMHIIETAKKAMEAVGVVPSTVPIRGGTDGARLSYMGLPCPNLCTGGHNFHGPYEYIPVQSMEKCTDILIKIVELTYA